LLLLDFDWDSGAARWLQSQDAEDGEQDGQRYYANDDSPSPLHKVVVAQRGERVNWLVCRDAS